MADEKIRYTVKDYLGNPTSVPADKVEAFLKRQEELKAMVERGEDPMKVEVGPERASQIKAALFARIKRAGEASGQQK